MTDKTDKAEAEQAANDKAAADKDLKPTTPTATAAEGPGNRPATQAEMGDPAEAEEAARKAAVDEKAKIGIVEEEPVAAAEEEPVEE